MSDFPKPTFAAQGTAVSHGAARAITRALPEETAIAFTYQGTTHAVMMATPSDLSDFAIGFALTEGVIHSRDDIESLDIVSNDVGVEVRCWLRSDLGAGYAQRRRSMAGPTGCGLCGIESLEDAMRAAPHVTSDFTVTPAQIVAAMDALPASQSLFAETRAVHGAAFWTPDAGLIATREDVGRHNALDKLVGALAQGNHDAARGLVVMTSRISVELVQKVARLGAPILVAISAPTALAVRTAETSGVTLVALARGQDFQIYTHAQRVLTGEPSHGA